MYTKHRTKEKKGGGLAIGHLINDNIKLEEIKTKNNNILVLEGTIHNGKIQIILTYLNCCKEVKGERYKENREIQKRNRKTNMLR